jgi:hypothetical protein
MSLVHNRSRFGALAEASGGVCRHLASAIYSAGGLCESVVQCCPVRDTTTGGLNLAVDADEPADLADISHSAL